MEHLQYRGEMAIMSTSPQAQQNIRNEMNALRNNFENLFKGLFFIVDIKLYLLKVKM